MRRKFFFLIAAFFICFTRLSALDFCWGHSPEIQKIRSIAVESITRSHKQGGKLFRSSFVFTPEEAAYELLKWRKTYSEFSDAFQDFIYSSHPEGLDPLYQGYAQVGDLFYNLYTECIAKHKNLAARYERGRIYFDRGLYEHCLSDIQPILDSGQWNHPKVEAYLSIQMRRNY